MKEYIVYANYDPATGISKMVKSNRYGTFSATAEVHEEDKDIANRWDGLRFCEFKIDMQSERVRASIFRERMNGVRNALCSIEPPEPGEDDYTWDKMMIQYMDLKRRYEESLKRYKQMKSAYHDFASECLVIRRKLHQYDAKHANV